MSIESKLGFDKIRESVIAACSTEYARNRCREETFSSSGSEVSRRLSLCDEMRQILMFESSFPDTGFNDCLPFLIPLQSDNVHIDLPSMAALRSSLDTLRKLVNFFESLKDGRYPALKEMTSPVVTFPEVLRRIDVIIDKYGDVRDGASDTLRDIRRKIHEKENIATKRIQAILHTAQAEGIAGEDAAVSIRDGKMLIPVTSGMKKKLPGIVYDESASGRTSFIEPMEIVELNNQMRELHFEEQREIIKILVEFSDFLRPYLPMIIPAQEYMGEIDFIRSKTSVSNRFTAGMPVISEQGELLLRKARHPLLERALEKEGKKIVPLDLSLTPSKRILLISGPNAGGKSVCLKTTGLLQYMLQWGMLIPASESSEMRLFDRIFIDIGDDQSIENDLSTYSSHLTNMKELLTSATSDSLVLIDEFGSGTEPAAGGAIAEQILSELEGRGCYGVITTHYTNLKFYASRSAAIQNGAMMFDVQKIEPLFRLEMGLPGSSFAFELARKIGLPESTVHGAEERAGSDFVTIERNLRKIARSKRSLEEKLAHIKITDRTLESVTDKYEKELSEIKALKKSIIEEAKTEANEILSRANKQIEKTIRDIKEAQAEKVRTAEARKELKEFKEKLERQEDSERDQQIEKKIAQLMERKKRREQRREERKNENEKNKASGNPVKEEVRVLEKGSKVKIKGGELLGEVLEISGRKAKVAVGSIISSMSTDKLEVLTANEFKSARKPVSAGVKTDVSITERKLNFKPSIDVRGQRLQEALDTVTRYIDDAIMVGYPEVSILHGKGDGILKEEIRKYLKIFPEIRGCRDEAVERGGAGITIVTFRQ